jgi:pyridoxal 5'-phosphate synthase pdxS subunit
MALERVPADIRSSGRGFRDERSGHDRGHHRCGHDSGDGQGADRHFVEAQVLQSFGVDYIDESEVLTPADYANHIDKWRFTVPFVCGATNLGERCGGSPRWRR